MRRIPLKISPAFFITAAIIGFVNSRSLVGTISWIGIIFVSVLLHEFGHALTALCFGQKPHIELVAFGGVTTPEGPKLKPWKEFLVVLMGPCAGLLIFVVSSLLLNTSIENGTIRMLLQNFRFVNLFWTFVNLLPILPLDGGQLVRIVLESIMGARAWKVTLCISLVVSVLFTVLFMLVGYYILGLVFILFIFQSIEGMKRFQHYSESDQKEDLREEFKAIELRISQGENEALLAPLESLRERAGRGMIYTMASEYLAKLLYEKGDSKKTYEILSSIQKGLSKEAQCLLYLTAYEIGDYNRVVDLSAVCFQEMQIPDVAIRAAAANAMLNDVYPAIEWLRTASRFQGIDLSVITIDQAFDPIRSDPEFHKLLHPSK